MTCLNRHRFYQQHFTVISSYQCKLQLRDHTYSMTFFTKPIVQVRAFVRERAGVCVCVVLFILFHCGFFV